MVKVSGVDNSFKRMFDYIERDIDKYQLRFFYDDDLHRYNLDGIKEIVFLDDALLIYSVLFDLKLFYYCNVDNVELLYFE